MTAVPLASLAREIAAAARRIRRHVVATPLEPSPYLSRLTGARVYLKLECVQRTGSFKLRGATNKLLTLPEAERRAGVIAASTGNHGLAVVDAAGRAGCPATIYLPEQTALGKLEALGELGAELELYGTDCEQTERFARAQAERQGRPFISPYNDLAVIAGQGTIAVELSEQLPEIDALCASVGGGGLLSGVGCYLRSVRPKVELCGCWPRRSPVLYESLQAGRIVELPSRPTLSDATAGGLEPGAVTFELCRQLIDSAVLVGEDDIRRAVKLVLERHRLVIEGAAGVAVAGLLQLRDKLCGKTVVVILCGRNLDLAQLRACLEVG